MFIKTCILALIAMTLAFAACGGGAEGPASIASGNPSDILATVNGTNITDGDVMKELAPRLKKCESEVLKMKEPVLNQMIEKKLLEQAAAKEGKSIEKYIEDYLAKNLTPPTEEEINKYYEFSKKNGEEKALSEIKEQLVNFINENKKNGLRMRLLANLRDNAAIDIKFEKPRVEIAIGKSPSIGPEDAPVTIVEFSDFQCPYCGRVRQTVREIIEAYPKEVRYVFKDNPLPFHRNAPKAHEAAHCAGEQGKYWEMNKLLFENQNALTVSDLKSYAKKVGLNTDKFNKCLDGSKYAEMVAKGLSEGEAAGASGTPAFFINGLFLSGAQPFASFKEIIESELKRKK